MASLDIDGTRFEYSENGSGEPLVMVHGSASDYRTWQFQRDAFAEQYRAISYSRRWHWPNDPVPEGTDYSMAQHVDDLRAIVRSLDATPAHLVGHSYGGFLSLLLAIAEPQLVRTLVLAEPPVITLFVSSTPKPTELLKLLLRRPRTAAAIVKFGAKGVAPASKAFRQGDMEAGIRAVGGAVFGRGGFDRLPEARQAQVRDNSTNVKAELLGSGSLPLEADRVRQVQIPTLLVTGERSLGLFQRLTDRLEELLPHAERVAIPGAMHMMHEDNAAAYNAAVLSFLSRQRPAA